MNLHFDKWQHIALIGSYCPIQTSVRYCIKSVTLHPNGKGTADGAIRSLKSIFPIRQAEDYCVLKDTARYVLSSSKYFKQLKTPYPCRVLDFLQSRKSLYVNSREYLTMQYNFNAARLILISKYPIKRKIFNPLIRYFKKNAYLCVQKMAIHIKNSHTDDFKIYAT